MPPFSIHALLAESDGAARYAPRIASFSIHALLAESDRVHKIAKNGITFSIHALLAESDRPRARCARGRPIFLSTLSLRRATFRLRSGHLVSAGFSIHALLAESDADTAMVFHSSLIFLSTLSLRRATEAIAAEISGSNLFYPRSPCGERRIKFKLDFVNQDFSIHALLAESDHNRRNRKQRHPLFYPRSPCGERLVSMLDSPNSKNFLSTLSLRRATGRKMKKNNKTTFLSTLSLRRATTIPCVHHHNNRVFYPRSPCGERLITIIEKLSETIFLSTLSLRRATPGGARVVAEVEVISIHALLAESDCSARSGFCRPRYFYPRSPCGERPANWFDLWGWAEYFYPRSPCGERQ